MKLLKAKIQNFQSFDDSGDITFSAGINLIIGQNNAGKSALLRALLVDLPDDRHRTANRWETHKLKQPEITLEISVSGQEIYDWILRKSDTFIPIKPGVKTAPYIDSFLKSPEIIFNVHRIPGSSFTAKYPSHGLFHHEPNTQQYSAMIRSANGILGAAVQQSSGRDSLPEMLWEAWQRDMFYVAAERMAIGEAPFKYEVKLLSNANNLPNVLHTLRGERGDLFARLVDHLREIFPTVGNLNVVTKPGTSTLEARIWPTQVMERVELSFPLNFSGTGVSQVIALLTAVMTVDKAIVLIDEINSFLHPAAIKALLRILQTRYTQHQYIITTHAPEVIGFSNPSTIHLVKRDGYESSIKLLDLKDVGNLREVAEHLGVSMADVFAAEKVVWVEGPTEELCFPYAYEKLIGPVPQGILFTSVVATGDFIAKKRDRELVYAIYNRLSTASAPLVKSVAFSFDAESLSDSQKDDMKREGRGKVHFLPRRHFECYLLNPEAIAAFILEKDVSSKNTVNADAVKTTMEKYAAEEKFHINEWNGRLDNDEWLKRIDAANLINEVCGQLTEQRIIFNKRGDSLFLLNHILLNSSGQLHSLKEYIAALIESVAD